MTDTQFAVLLDLDGTLVDSVYHHVLAWDAALAERGYDVPLWRVHAGIGMGSARLLPWLLGEHPDDADALTDGHRRRFLDMAEQLRPTRGALALLDDLHEREVPFQISTSANPEEREALVEALGVEDLPYTDAGDVDAPKPAPDLLAATCEELGVAPERALMIGDSPWDHEAARRVGIRSLAVRCGGFPDAALAGAGAYDVVDDPRELLGRL